jgi:hypothetical protein
MFDVFNMPGIGPQPDTFVKDNVKIKGMKKRLMEEEETDDSPRYYNEMPSMSIQGYIDTMRSNGYKRGIKKWNIWIPSGYNNIDEKIEKIKIKNDEQIIFAIPGCDNLVSKYNVWKSLVDLYGREEASKIVPESFLLDKKEDVEILKDMKETKFILKKKKQRKLGLKLTNDIDVDKSIEEEYTIAQRYITPFLVNKRKINLRIYLLITLKNNVLTAYVSHYGTCIYTKQEYDGESNDFEKNITSYNLDLDVYEKNPMTLEQFRTYLFDNGFDPEKPFQSINDKIKMFLLSLKNQLGNKKFEKNLCFQVFGLDFIMSEDLDGYLLEWNKGPEMKPKVTSIDDPREITDEIKQEIEKLKESLSEINIDSIKQIKKTYKKLYEKYPKLISHEEILEKIEKFYLEEEKMKSYPKGYITGGGLKVQKDALHTIGIITENENNGFFKILEI